MPQTIETTPDGHIIAGGFSNRVNALEALHAFRDLGLSQDKIHLVEPKAGSGDAEIYARQLTDRGFADKQAQYYGDYVRDGKFLICVEGVGDPAPIINVFDEFGAEYNPNGSRNVRQDVVGLTAGAVAGAIAGGAVGAVATGPLGVVVGAAAGAALGGSAGAAIGTVVEHHK